MEEPDARHFPTFLPVLWHVVATLSERNGPGTKNSKSRGKHPGFYCLKTPHEDCIGTGAVNQVFNAERSISVRFHFFDFHTSELG